MMDSDQPGILFCDCSHADIVPEKTRNSLKRALRESGLSFEAVPDLCGFAARRNGALEKYAGKGPLYIVACFPRAVKWLFHAAGAALPEDAGILNMRSETAERLIAKLPKKTGRGSPIQRQKTGQGGSERFESTGRGGPDENADAGEAHAPPGDPGGWVPWFPVIDYSRCNGCRQCMSFCLFNVFNLLEDGTVEVRNPRNCKTNCPACARICPEAAIIFPKYGAAPVNGDEVLPGHMEERVKVDLAKLFQGDVYGALRRRGGAKKPRFRSLKEMKKAMEERRRCAGLSELQEKLDIPPEIMKSLRGCDCDCDCDGDCEGSEEGESSCSDCCCE